MLVNEDGDALARVAEALEDLAEELGPRIELLELLVERIVPVLGDQEGAVHSELPGAKRQGIGDRRTQADAVLLRLGQAEVVGRSLGEVHAGNSEGRTMEPF